MTRTDDDLTPEEREALRRLPREAAPPPALEDATVAALGARGLLRRTARPRGIRPALVLAASLLLFAGGVAIGRSGGGAAPAEDGRARFVFLLYEGPEYDQPAPEAMAERVREYVAWAGRDWEHGAVEGGEKLSDAADLAVEPGGGAEEVAPEPGERRLAGYFLVRAADRGAALEIARTCPHVRYGGRIVIREIETT